MTDPAPTAPVVPQDPPADPPNPTDPAPTPPAPPADPAPKPAKRSLEDSLASLDDETKAYVLGEVQKARREAGDARSAAKKTAAEEARTELAAQIAKIIDPTSETPADPAALTEQITTATADARAAKVELAVFRAAGSLGGDPSALLDSRSFMATLASVDPADNEAVQAAISVALEANPTLKVTPTRRVPGPLPTPGGAPPPALDDQIAAAKKAGNLRLALHLENQKLTAPSR